MKTLKLLLVAGGVLLSTHAGSAQSVRAQLVHVSADPAVDTVDVYLDGSLIIDDFGYPSATPFMDLDAGSHNVALTGQSGTDTLASFPIELEDGSSYHLIVAGVMNPDEFNPNPDGRDISLNLFVEPDALEQSPDDRFWARQFYAGTDLPKLRFTYGANNHTPFDDASYGDITDYGGDEGEVAKLKLFAPGTTGSALWEATSDSRPLAGKAFLGVVYGRFRDDDGMGFNLANVLTDGTVELYTEDVSIYRAQIVHNAADTLLRHVDLYMDGGLLVRDFEFQTATKYLELPAGIHTFKIVPAGSTDQSDALMTKRVTMREGRTYSVVAAGVVDPGQWSANPDGRDTGLDLFMADGAVEATGNPNEFTLRQFYGMTDLPSCRFFNGSDPLFGNAGYGDYTEYVTGETGYYVGRLQSAGTTTATLVELQGDFSSVGGLGILEMPSGFFAEDGALSIEWIEVLPDGTIIKPRQLTKTVDVQIIHASADPAVETVDVYFDGGLLIDDLAFKSAKPFVKLPFGTHEFAIAEASSTSKEGSIKTRRQSFADGRNYTMVLAGVAEPEQWPANPDGRNISLNLFVADDALTASPRIAEASVRQFYGIINMPTSEFWHENANNILFPDVGFGAFTEMVQVDVTEEQEGVLRRAGSGQDGEKLLEERMNFGGFFGRSVIEVLAGQFHGELHVFYVTGNGSIDSPNHLTAVDAEVDYEIPTAFEVYGNYPNPFNPSTSIVFDLPEAASVSVEVYDATGRMVFRTGEARYMVGAGHAVHVDATAWSSGLYLYKVIARGRTSSWTGSGRMVLVK